MRTVSAALIATQKLAAGYRTPYVHLLLTDPTGVITVDLSTDAAVGGNQILLIDHHEDAYSDYATVVINNWAGLFDSTELRGYWTEIGYGDVLTGTPTYAATARLWVKHQQHLFLGGRKLLVLELEGMWSRLNETVLGMGAGPNYYVDTEAAVGEPGYVAGVSGANLTVYDFIDYILTNKVTPAMSLDTLVDDDGVIDTLVPIFSINQFQRFESAGKVIYTLLAMTYSSLRPKNGLAWEVVYPETDDTLAITYYRAASPYFYEFTSRRNLAVPNRIVVFANAGTDGLWLSIITAVANNTAQQTLYGSVEPEIVWAPELTTQNDADTRAAAILARTEQEEWTGKLIVPHDCQIELLDFIGVVSVGATVEKLRATSLRHVYRPGSYRLEITMGDIVGDVEIAQQQFVEPTIAPFIGPQIPFGPQPIPGHPGIDTLTRPMPVVPSPIAVPSPAPTPTPAGVWRPSAFAEFKQATAMPTPTSVPTALEPSPIIDIAKTRGIIGRALGRAWSWTRRRYGR